MVARDQDLFGATVTNPAVLPDPSDTFDGREQRVVAEAWK